jgi:glycine/D-amino acid oxidase-like deaminating enzyme
VLAARWLSFPPVWGLKGHSIVFETGVLIPPEALFLEFEEPGGATLSPEIFPRPDGTTYVCAISTESPLPVDPASVAPDDGAIDRLKALCARISPVLANSRVVTSGACHRPITRDGMPLIGAVPGARGVYVATGCQSARKRDPLSASKRGSDSNLLQFGLTMNSIPEGNRCCGQRYFTCPVRTDNRAYRT